MALAAQAALLVTSERQIVDDNERKKKIVMTDMVAPETDTSASVTSLYCATCGANCCAVARKLADLPKRSTGDHAVSEATELLKVSLVRGDAKRIRRAGGIERQYRLNCPECGVFIAYRPVPYDEPSPLFYIVSDALTTTLAEVARYKESQVELPACLASADGALRVTVDVVADKTVESAILGINEFRVAVRVRSSSDEGSMNAALLKFMAIVLEAPEAALGLELQGSSLVLTVARMPGRVAYGRLKKCMR